MKYHILSIGVSKHQNPGIGTLRFADKDAKDFFTLFTSNIGEIGYQKLLTNSEANLSAIRSALGKDLQQEIGPDDAFFFFFSGHGGIAEDQEGKALANYLIPFDATSDITNSAISIDYLKESFARIKCKASFVFIDSCFSGSINGKCYLLPNKKSLKNIKQFTAESLGEGSVVFTASKSDEEALEDSENEYGLFTNFLLKDLQKERASDLYPVTDIFTPVIQGVIDRAKEKYNHSQTPTINAHFEGVVNLPVFKKPLKIAPDMIEVPSSPQLNMASFLPPEIGVGDKEQKKLIDSLIALVAGPQDNDLVKEITYERFCTRLIQKLKEQWEKLFTEAGSDVSKIPDAVSKLEAHSYQLIVLGSITAIFGSDRMIKMYSEIVVTLLDWTKQRAGLVALISVPEIILVEIIYSIGIVSLARQNLKPFDVLLSTAIEDIENENAPESLSAYYHIHYCDALGGNATKVCDHIREVIKTYNWIYELAPKLEGKIDDYQLQVNFILAMLTLHQGERFYPDFGRFYAQQLKPLVDKIKYNQEFRAQIASMFKVKQEEIGPLLFNLFQGLFGQGSLGFWWESIRPDCLLTAEELKLVKQAEGQSK